MTAYYNEWDAHAAQWLRNLIAAGRLPTGDVDERSITDVEPEELAGYTQHHFFAGIGGWALATRLASVGDTERIVTGSPPCQPFSTAGRGGGYADERHLAPHWLRLVAAIRPDWVFGEQVAAAIRKDDWLDDLLDALEGEGYATGATVLPACSVGAPHIRQRLWVVARLGDGQQPRLEGHSGHGDRGRKRSEPAGSVAEAGGAGGVGDSANERCGKTRSSFRPPSERASDDCESIGMADSSSDRRRARRGWDNTGNDWHKPNSSDRNGWMAKPNGAGQQSRSTSAEATRHGSAAKSESGADRHESAGTSQTGWNDPDWLYCRDGKWRPVESGTFPLAHGIPARVGRLRAYGNAIVPQVAAEVIKEAMGDR